MPDLTRRKVQIRVPAARLNVRPILRALPRELFTPFEVPWSLMPLQFHRKTIINLQDSSAARVMERESTKPPRKGGS
jgi:hypothetical protein